MDPYELGQNAYAAGESSGSNPFQRHRQREQWFDGWLDAQREDWASSPGEYDCPYDPDQSCLMQDCHGC